ncbi:hypothetical protein QFC24_006319 [Naganishia onofrii]|uniref:Uncharacterized protein n=1 Tax=Naganishia onofrii TaxID=1851511 RepID=A0ACC2X433_9TREE|nr:hypothetical protein QFC24_006319 [Naganishia onofrii]
MKFPLLLLFTLPLVYACNLNDVDCLCRDPAVIESLTLCIPNTCNGLDARAAAAFGTQYCQNVGQPLDPGIGLASKTTVDTATTTATVTTLVDGAAASSATSLVLSALSSASGIVESVDQSVSSVLASATSAANSAKSSVASAATSIVASATSAALSSPSSNAASALNSGGPGVGLLAGLLVMLLAI